MKEIVIYIQTVNQSDENLSKKWLHLFTQNLQKSLDIFDVNVNAITNQKEAFFNSLKGQIVGCYLPIIDKAFIDSDSDIYSYKNIVSTIENNYSKQAFHLCLIEDVLPINHASYQPFYKFFNQGNSNQEFIGRDQEKQLPGNNNFVSFKNHIQHIAKEISYQLLKLSANRTNGAKVFIGSTTSDLTEPVKTLYNFLLEQGIDVVTPISPSGLGSQYIEKKISQLMQRCWLAIHPLGSGTLDKQLFLEDNSNLCELENKISAQHYIENKADYLSEREFKRIIWTPRTPSKSMFEGRMIERITAQAKSNSNADILDCSFDELKEIILSYYKESIKNEFDNTAFSEKQPETEIPDYNNNTKRKVLVLYESSYVSTLKELAPILAENDFQLVTLKELENEIDFTSAKNKALQKCDGVIFLTSNWNTVWFRSNLNEVVKAKSIRSLPFSFLCIISKEIDQLPQYFDKDLQIIRMNGEINQILLKTLLVNKDNSKI